MQEEQGSAIHKVQIQLYNLIENGAKSMGDLFKEMARLLSERLDVERVTIWRFSKNLEELRIVGAHQRMVDQPVTGMIVPATGSSDFLEAVEQRRTIAAEDVTAHPLIAGLIRDYFTGHEIRSAIFVPLHANGKVRGGVAFEHPGERRSWSKAEIDTAGRLAVPFGLALQRLEQEEHQQQLAAIEEFCDLVSGGADLFSFLDGLLSECLDLARADGARAYLKEPGMKAMRCAAAMGVKQEGVGKILAWGEGAVGEVVETGIPLVEQDYAAWASGSQTPDEEGISSMLCIPIPWRGEMVGAIQVFTQEDSRALGWDDYDLLSPVVRQFAVLIDETRLLETNRRLLALDAELHEIGIAAEAATEIPDLLNTTLELACRAMAADFCIGELKGQGVTVGYSEKSGKVIAEYFRETVPDFPGVVRVNDWQSPPDMAAKIAGELVRFDLRASIVVPLTIDGKSEGMLILAMKQPRVWRDEEGDWLENVGVLVSAAAERIHSEMEAHNQAHLLKILESATDGLNRELNFNDTIGAVGDGILTLGKAYRGAIIMHQSRGEIFIPWMTGLPREYTSSVISQVPSADTSRLFDLPGPVMLSANAISARDAKLRNILQGENFHSIGLWPMLFDERVIAVAACFYDTPPNLLQIDHQAMLMFLRQAAAALENSRLYEQLEHHYLQAAIALANTINDFEDGTPERSRELAEMAKKIGQSLGLADHDIEAVYWAALTHDIGKTQIPGRVLRKETPLNEEDWSVLKKIPLEGEKRLYPIRQLREAGRLVRNMRERYDGSGYPDGLMGEQIPIGSRILAVVDSYQAMTTEKPYRPTRSHEEAVSEVRRASGRQFDPRVVEVFVQAANTLPGAAIRRN